jgi:hypothetical protein
MNLVGCGGAAFPAAARTDRPELAKVIRRLDAGDVLVVTRLTPRPPRNRNIEVLQNVQL